MSFPRTAGLANAADGLEVMVQAALPPLTGLIITMAAGVLSPLLISFNATIHAAVDVPGTVAAMVRRRDSACVCCYCVCCHVRL